jgi:hypothetical protein
MHLQSSAGLVAKATTPNSNTVKVYTTEAQTTTTTSKQYNATIGACATVRYNVTVADSSTVTEESVTLSALSDNVYGNITACTNAGPNPAACANTGGILVLGTNCLLGTGVGTLAGSHATLGGTNVTTAGSVTIPGNKSYTCMFDGQFCSGNTPNGGSPITLDAGGCMTLADTVTSTQTPDEPLTGVTCEDSNGNPITCASLGITSSITVKECIAGAQQP